MLATINVVERHKDASVLEVQIQKSRDLGYARIHMNDYEVTISNRQGQTMATGKNISRNQVLEFILRTWW